jgi:uncharacterized repeat protein (TIGR01451 family)
MSAFSRVFANNRKITLVGAGVGLCMLSAPAAALLGAGTPVVLASSGGDGNKGDVWLDNVGQPPGPGHEMDPHLACADINLWGAGLADGSGWYVVDGWPPSGAHEQDYPASGSGAWAYDRAAGGDQVIDVIDVGKLIANAEANGDTAHNKQGFHFKLQLSQDPQKHKTFWVNCPATTPSSPPPSLVLSKTVSQSGAVPVNTLLTYTITLKNVSTGAASNVTVDDTMSGTAGFTVNDGTGGTANSFAGTPLVTVTKVGAGHYRWTYAAVAGNATDVVTYSVVIRSPGGTSTSLNGSFSLVNTATNPDGNCKMPDVPACTTENGISLSGAPVIGGVSALSTSTPTTGAANQPALAASAFLLLGGAGLALLGLLVRQPAPQPVRRDRR